MDKKRSDHRFSLNSIINFLNEKKIFKSFRITYQVVWNLLLISIISLVSVGLFVGGAGAGYFASLVMDEPIRSKDDMHKDIYNYEEVSEIYFANGVFLGDLPSELERREISLKEISPYLINAIIATEDEYFYEHDGIVPKAIFRATFQEFSNSSVQTGGSTLTQQLIKNQILTNEVSFDRKAKEILLAMRLENFFEKEEILEAYLNIVPFGRNANGRNIAGIQAASLGIFGVDAKDLSIPQAAYIAGLPQSPFGYTPFKSPAHGGGIKDDLTPSLNRMKTVLTRMRDKGYLTEAEFTNALEYDIRANLIEPSASTLEEYPYILQEVEKRTADIIAKKMMTADGIDIEAMEEGKQKDALIAQYDKQARRDIRRKGYEIHTTINKEIYDAQQEVIKNNKLFGGLNKHGEPEEVGSVLIDNRTGAIVSFIGGRDFWRENLNHSTQAFRQNGSTMKPLLAYGPAFELGLLQPGYVLPDTPYFYKSAPEKEVRNVAKHRGLITIRESLQVSQNVPAVKAFNLLPQGYGREILMKMGITKLIPGEPFESTSIGGLHLGVSVEQNTNAYTVFANEGKYIPTYMIEKVVAKDGTVIYEHEHEEIEVFSPQTAYLILDILRDVHVGIGTARSVPGMLNFHTDLAGKTGTTNESYDSWYVGFNPRFTMGVWIGYKTNATLQGQTGPRTQRIWANLANAAYAVDPDFIAPNERFKMPSGIVTQSFCGISGLLASDLCREAGLVKTDLFNVKYVPTKVDDSLERVDFVMLNGEPYRALENTPKEFTQNGIAIKSDLLESTEDFLSFLPSSWEDKIIPDRKAVDNGKTPSPVSGVKIEGTKLSWKQHGDEDIVGYRIYRAANGSNAFTLIENVRSDQKTELNILPGVYAYKVIAVDVTGRESGDSVIATSGDWKDTPAEDKPKDDDKKKDDKKPKDEDGNPGNSTDPIIPDPIDDLLNP